MIDPKRKHEIRERLEKAQAANASSAYGQGEAMASALLVIKSLNDLRDLLTALEEMEADNAARVRTTKALAREHIKAAEEYEKNPAPNDAHMAIICRSIAGQLEKLVDADFSKSATALLARHAEELTAKDALNAAFVLDAAKELNRTKALQADLDRAREALREYAIMWPDTQDGRDYPGHCAVCDAYWLVGYTESHNLVTINGVETAGPCPAAPAPSKEPSNG